MSTRSWELHNYSYDAYGNTTQLTWQQGSSTNGPADLAFTHGFVGTNGKNANQIEDVDFDYDLNGNARWSKYTTAGALAASWDSRNRMLAYQINPKGAGNPIEFYSYDADGFRVLRTPILADGKPIISIRDASGQVVSEYTHESQDATPSLLKDFVYGAGQLLVERSVVDIIPKMVTSSSFYTSGSYGFTLTKGTSAASYSVDVRTDSGYTAQITGVVPGAGGAFSIPDTNFSPGETNYVRIRAENQDGAAYSRAVAIAVDPTVTSESENQIRAMSVSRSGQDIVLRWHQLSSNGESTTLFSTNSSQGSDIQLTSTPLNPGVSTFTVEMQALASPCDPVYGTQPAQGGGVLTSIGSHIPSASAVQFLGAQQSNCLPGPPSSSGYIMSDLFHHRDHLGNLRLVTNAGGWKDSGHDYYPNGREMLGAGESEAGDSRRRFTGHERDEQTGLDYMFARHYAPNLGRFLSVDPLGSSARRELPQTWNRYTYTVNNPLRYVDPRGLTESKKEETYAHDTSSAGQAAGNAGVITGTVTGDDGSVTASGMTVSGSATSRTDEGGVSAEASLISAEGEINPDGAVSGSAQLKGVAGHATATASTSTDKGAGFDFSASASLVEGSASVSASGTIMGKEVKVTVGGTIGIGAAAGFNVKIGKNGAGTDKPGGTIGGKAGLGVYWGLNLGLAIKPKPSSP